MDDWFATNRANWDDRAVIHAVSTFYDVEGWLRDEPGPTPLERSALGDVDGLSLVHLQCHIGTDTLRWARVGATVTGVDFSTLAIREATTLARRARLAERSRFLCANVYDAPEILGGERFDLVYVSLGSLCWLPSIEGWAKVVARLLTPGGRLYVHDVHPLSNSLDDDGERLAFGYFESAEPLVFDSDETYTDGAALPVLRPLSGTTRSPTSLARCDATVSWWTPSTNSTGRCLRSFPGSRNQAREPGRSRGTGPEYLWPSRWWRTERPSSAFAR